MDNKKKILSIIILIIILISIIVILINKISKGKKVEEKSIEGFDISQIFGLENIENSEIEISKSKNEKVATKYAVGSNTYVVEGTVMLNERKGKVIFLRDGYNDANIYQTSYKIDEDDSISAQVNKYMETFINMCTGYIGIMSDQEPSSKILYGNNTSTVNIPLEESIYNENRLYSLTYKI